MRKNQIGIFPDDFGRPKKFELRLADLEINEGDIFVLKEWNPAAQDYTGRIIEKEVACVVRTKDTNYFAENEIEKFGYQVISFN